MIDMIKRKLKKSNDHGSSFVLVIVATTFMCILASALLMGALMTYKLKYYKLNSLNNFYEVETALDEIYAGVGAATNEHLYSAYTTTAELVVVYDTSKHVYTTMNNEEANELFKKLFITGFTNDVNYKSLDKMTATLKSFISNEKTDANPSGIDLVKNKLQLVYTEENGNSRTQYYDNTGRVKYSKKGAYTGKNITSITLKNVTVKRNVTLSGTTSGTYEQSITTDIVLTEPEYNVSFDISGTKADSLYEYAILADMGIEVGEDDDTQTTDVSINGNIYAANDYYNKDYNADAATKVTTKYDSFSDQTPTWGSTNKSAYSGIFANGKNTTVTLLSDVIVCPGTLAAYNGAGIKLRGRSQKLSELWTDGIVIGGKDGGSINAAANAYVYDDTELNADKSKISFSSDSNYLGYSFNAKDTRSISLLKGKPGYLVSGAKLRSHYSDSAVIVNGRNTSLDMKKLNSLYIAGKSYIEFSKIAASSISEDDKVKTEADNNDPDKIKVDTGADYAFTNLTDYSTGQSLDVKTNQLMFLAQWAVVEDSEQTDPDTGITTVTLRFPSSTNTVIRDNVYGVASDVDGDALLSEISANDYQVRAIKQRVSGHDYYYLYIEDTKDTNGQSKAEKFVERYYKALEDYSDEVTKDLYNVRNYKNFDVQILLPDDSKINASAAVTAQNEDDNSLFLKSSVSVRNDVNNVLLNIVTGKTYMSMFGDTTGEESKDKLEGLRSTYASRLAGYGDSATTAAEKASNLLTYMYINMKDHLSVANKVDADKNEVNAWAIAGYKLGTNGYDTSYNARTDTYDCNNSITPINNFVNLSDVISKNKSIVKTMGDASKNKQQVIIVNPGDVVVQANNNDGSVQGIIIAAGDVRFADNVKSFKGMIITGAKLIVDHNMTISSDASFVANMLDKRAEESSDADSQYIVGLFKNYVKSGDSTTSTVTGVSISDISYEDILVFQNWKRNVE